MASTYWGEEGKGWHILIRTLSQLADWVKVSMLESRIAQTSTLSINEPHVTFISLGSHIKITIHFTSDTPHQYQQ